MTPLLQLFQKGSTSYSYYNQHAVLVFLVAVKEMMGNIHKWLSIIYGIVAVISSTIGHWPKRVRDVEVRKMQLLDFSPSAGKVMVTIFWSCEGLILLDVMQREMTVNSDTKPAYQKSEEVFPVCLA